MSYVSEQLEKLKAKNSNEPEFIQAATEVLTSLEPVFEQNPQYEENGILERITEPERVIMFRVPWMDDKGEIHVIMRPNGSGKSTLVNEILYKTIARDLNGAKEKPGKCKEIKGIENIDKIINIDQSPIGRTPRSNPATYTGVFDHIRDLTFLILFFLFEFIVIGGLKVFFLLIFHELFSIKNFYQFYNSEFLKKIELIN